MTGVLSREELAKELGIPSSRLRYSPTVPGVNRKMRRKLAKLARKKDK